MLLLCDQNITLKKFFTLDVKFNPLSNNPTSGPSGSALKTGRHEIPDSIPIVLAYLADRSFPLFSQKLA